MRVVLGLVLASAGFAAPVAAQSATAEDQLRDVQQCRSISDRDARLACFDKASTPIPLVAAPPRVQSPDRADTPERQRASRSTRAQAAPPPESALGAAHLVSLREGTPGQWQFTLDNGSRWRMIEGKSAMDLPKRGATITVRHTALGGYLLDWGTSVSVRVAPAD